MQPSWTRTRIHRATRRAGRLSGHAGRGYLLALTLAWAQPGAGANEGSSEADTQMRALYAFHCMGCHLEDGSGMPGRVPSLRGVGERFLGLAGGRAYLVQVPGVAQSSLSDARLTALMNWLLAAMREDPASAVFPPYTADEVSKLRKKRVPDIIGLRRELISAAAAARQPPSFTRSTGD